MGSSPQSGETWTGVVAAWGWGLALWARAVPWTRCQGGVAMAECSWAHLKLSGCQPSTRQGARDMCEAGKAREACSGRTQRGVAGGSLQHAEGVSSRKECT